MVFILILSAAEAGAFSGDFTANLARQCRALKIEKLKAPLFRGPEGAGATNDWCISGTEYNDRYTNGAVSSGGKQKK